MIFVTVGTNEARFDRLLEAVAALPFDEPVVVQHGHSAALGPTGATLVDFLTFDEMVETMRAARVVVTHAGVGSIMFALAERRRPVVVPRRKSLAEAVDDHQLQLGRRFAAAGLVTLVDPLDRLADAIGSGSAAAEITTAHSALAADLRVFLEQAV